VKQTLFVLGLLCFSITAAAEAPQIKLGQALHDFGKVEEGTVVESSFSLSNTGNAQLDIQRTVPSCGCVVADLTKTSLLPGESTEFKVRFDTTGFFGHKTKTVRLYTNDREEPSSLFTIKGEILRAVEVTPSRVIFGDILSGAPVEKTFRLTKRKGSISFDGPYTRSKSLEVSTEGEGLYRVKIRPDAPKGILRATVLIPTKVEKSERVTVVPVFARIQGDLQLNITSLSFGLLDAPVTAAVVKKVLLTNVAGDSPKIVSIESTNPAIFAEASAIKPGKLFEISVHLQPGSTGTISSLLSINTDRTGDNKTVTLPVSAVIADQGE